VERVELSPHLAYTMGFVVSAARSEPTTQTTTITPATTLAAGDATKSVWLEREQYAKYMADISGGIHSLFIYTDIVENSIVSNTTAPLLRVVTIDYQKTVVDVQ